MNPAIIAGLIAAGGSVVSNVLNSAEAARNRRFQERMSSSAHQREVSDLRAAGLNPMLSARSGGSSTPGGDRAPIEDSVAKGVSTALQAKALNAQIELMKAQAQQAYAGANQSNQQAEDVFATRAGRLDLTRAQAVLATSNADQVRQMMPELVAKAREEVNLVANSARAAKARAILDEAAATGAGNIEEFERSLGQAAPWARALFQALRLLRR